MNLQSEFDVIIIGGGIAGTTCAENILQFSSNLSLLLITSSSTIKKVTNFIQKTRLLQTFDVEEVSIENSNFNTLVDNVVKIFPREKSLQTRDSGRFLYKRLCVCTGCSPRTLNVADSVVYLRDLTTIEYLTDRVKSCEKIVIVGNGGIANDIVHRIKNCDIFWAIKHDHINSPFLDSGASKFLLQTIPVSKTIESSTSNFIKQASVNCSKHLYDCSVGTKWQGLLQGCLDREGELVIKYNAEISNVVCNGSCFTAVFTDGSFVECDSVVCAIGVESNVVDLFETAPHVKNNAVAVDRDMRTSDPSIYAAGDCACASWEDTNLWFQMRLWSQAKEMGFQAGQSILSSFGLDSLPTWDLFNIFSHSTWFFGFKVVLLGLYNGQGLEKDEFVVHLRVEEGKEYVKVVLRDGRMVGAMVLGEGDLAETLENLICDQLDLSFMGDQLLSTDIDIEDYFD